MNIKTEQTLRSIFAIDETIPQARIDEVIRILQGRISEKKAPQQTLRFNEVMALLGVSRRTITNYIHSGHLELVFGSGTTRALGVTMDSYSNFVHTRSQNRNPPSPEKERRRIEAIRQKAEMRSHVLNGKILTIRRLLKIDEDASQKERYKAISRLLNSSSRFSKTLVCKAAGVNLTAYINYAQRPKEYWLAQRQKETVALQIIRTSQINPNDKIGLLEAHKLVRNHGIHIAVKTIAKLLDASGFNRERKGSRNDKPL